jgi:hypothetical protein
LNLSSPQDAYPKDGISRARALALEKGESLRSKRWPNGRRDLALSRDPLVFVSRADLP